MSELSREVPLAIEPKTASRLKPPPRLRQIRTRRIKWARIRDPLQWATGTLSNPATGTQWCNPVTARRTNWQPWPGKWSSTRSRTWCIRWHRCCRHPWPLVCQELRSIYLCWQRQESCGNNRSALEL